MGTLVQELPPRCRLLWFRRCSARHARPLPPSSATWAPLPRSSLPVRALSCTFRMPAGAWVWPSLAFLSPTVPSQCAAQESQRGRGGARRCRDILPASWMAHVVVRRKQMWTQAGGGETGMVYARAHSKEMLVIAAPYELDCPEILRSTAAQQPGDHHNSSAAHHSSTQAQQYTSSISTPHSRQSSTTAERSTAARSACQVCKRTH